MNIVHWWNLNICFLINWIKLWTTFTNKPINVDHETFSIQETIVVNKCITSSLARARHGHDLNANKLFFYKVYDVYTKGMINELYECWSCVVSLIILTCLSVILIYTKTQCLLYYFVCLHLKMQLMNFTIVNVNASLYYMYTCMKVPFLFC